MQIKITTIMKNSMELLLIWCKLKEKVIVGI